MKRSPAPFRRVLIPIVLLALLGGGWWLARRAFSPSADTLVEKAVGLAQDRGITSFDGGKAGAGGNPLEEAVGLALEGVNLFQGSKGNELWRLKASWAHLSQENDVINVDNPHVVYAMGDTGLPASPQGGENAAENAKSADAQNAADAGAPPPDFPDYGDADVLDVTSRKGRITDHQRHLTLWDDVVITRFGDKLTGPRMNYDSATRIMTFPEGAALESERGSGTANVLHWDLAQNEITGLDGVLVVLKARPETAPEAASATGPAPEQAVKAAPAAAPKTDNASKTAPKAVSKADGKEKPQAVRSKKTEARKTQKAGTGTSPKVKNESRKTKADAKTDTGKAQKAQTPRARKTAPDTNQKSKTQKTQKDAKQAATATSSTPRKTEGASSASRSATPTSGKP